MPALKSEQVEALDLMEEVCDELALSFHLAPGEIVVANNYDVLHARAAFQDQATEPVANRHMLRLWFSLPNGRALPPVFERTRECHYRYARRASGSASD